jgi:hypothetical protein
VFKRLLGQIVVVSLALSSLTACSSAGNKDCKILREAREILVAGSASSNLTYSGESMTNYYSKIEESQLLFEEPKVREQVLNYLDSMNNTSEILPDLWGFYWDRQTKSFVKITDNYC